MDLPTEPVTTPPTAPTPDTDEWETQARLREGHDFTEAEILRAATGEIIPGLTVPSMLGPVPPPPDRRTWPAFCQARHVGFLEVPAHYHKMNTLLVWRAWCALNELPCVEIAKPNMWGGWELDWSLAADYVLTPYGLRAMGEAWRRCELASPRWWMSGERGWLRDVTEEQVRAVAPLIVAIGRDARCVGPRPISPFGRPRDVGANGGRAAPG